MKRPKPHLRDRVWWAVERWMAAVSYLPVPGLGFVAVYAAPKSRLARFHGVQGGVLVLASWILMASAGALLTVPGMAWLATVIVVVYVAAALVGSGSAARGHFARVPGVWHIVRQLQMLRMTGR